MAGALRVLSKLGALSLSPPASGGCRFASRGASKAWMGPSHGHGAHRASRHSDDMSDEELELEDVEDKLDRQRTVKYHVLRRQMTPPGAPQRKLTWDAIEQIRYLKQEQPDEWTVERLAEGFSVTPEVILRVLRSKFVPTTERKAKQDAKVIVQLGPKVLPSGGGTVQDRLKLPGNHTPDTLPPGRGDGAIMPVADQTLMLRGEVLRYLAHSPAPVPVLRTQLREEIKMDRTTDTKSTEEDTQEEDIWDGQVLTEEDLEELMETEKPPPVVQVGKDFFDIEGKFLYRI
uniref:Neugrin n=1 Tax=Mola mola TaxID=94237 RepID=A0A3Q3VKT6_MOLML